LKEEEFISETKGIISTNNNIKIEDKAALFEFKNISEILIKDAISNEIKYYIRKIY